jgi:hypothetical protein
LTYDKICVQVETVLGSNRCIRQLSLTLFAQCCESGKDAFELWVKYVMLLALAKKSFLYSSECMSGGVILIASTTHVSKFESDGQHWNVLQMQEVTLQRMIASGWSNGLFSCKDLPLHPQQRRLLLQQQLEGMKRFPNYLHRWRAEILTAEDSERILSIVPSRCR